VTFFENIMFLKSFKILVLFLSKSRKCSLKSLNCNLLKIFLLFLSVFRMLKASIKSKHGEATFEVSFDSKSSAFYLRLRRGC